jgi:hypothetical protein
VASRVLFRHPPLAFWSAASAVLALVAVLVAVLAAAPGVGRGPDGVETASRSTADQRGQVLLLRSEVAELIVLARDPGPELFARAGELADHTAAQAGRNIEPLSSGYRRLADELAALAALGPTGPALAPGSGPDPTPGGWEPVTLSSLTGDGEAPSVSAPPGFSPSEVSLQLSRVLLAADRLAALAWS